MRTLLKYAALVILLLIGGIQFIRPARTNPTIDPAMALPAHVPVPSDVAAILERGCRDCHSNGTQWPWYSNVAPVSWFVIDHVNHGRSHFNYSEWGKYTPTEAATLLKDSCELARKGGMPLNSYLWMHGSARLSARDVDTLCQWTRSITLAAAH